MMSRIAAFALLTVLSPAAWAQDGASIYKAKCANCHGTQGQGKGKAMPKVVGTTKSEDEIVGLLTKGGATKAPHVKPVAGMQNNQVKAVAAFVKAMK
jgi:mono/diheme cytochrome c family protein